MSWFKYLEENKKNVKISFDKDGKDTKAQFVEANEYGIVVIIDQFEKPSFYPWKDIFCIDEEE